MLVKIVDHKFKLGSKKILRLPIHASQSPIRLDSGLCGDSGPIEEILSHYPCLP